MIDPRDLVIERLCARDGTFALRLRHLPSGVEVVGQAVPAESDAREEEHQRDSLIAELDRRVAEVVANRERLWEALRSPEPVAALVQLVKEWKAAGSTRDEVERRLTDFLKEVVATGAPDQDDPVRDVLDFVGGFCSPDARIFP